MAKYALVDPDNKIAAWHDREPEDRLILPGKDWRLIPEKEAEGLQDAPPQPVTKGFGVEPEGFRLKDDESAVAAFTALWVMHSSMLGSKPDTEVSFYDLFDQKQTVTFSRWAEIMQSYSVHVARLSGL